MLRAKGNILLNGTTYAKGDLLPDILDERQQKQLLDAGSAELVTEPQLNTPEPKAPAKKTVGEQPTLEWTKVKLLGHARKLGLELDQSKTKAEILEAIKNAPDAPAEPVNPEVEEQKTPAITINENYTPPAEDEGEDGEETPENENEPEK